MSEQEDRLKIANIVSRHMDKLFEDLDKSGVDTEDIYEILLDQEDIETQYFRWREH